MKTKHILIFCISVLWLPFSGMAQQTKETDTVVTIKEPYGLRLGIDLSKPIRTLLESDYSGFEIMGDFRISKRFYLAAEFGNEKKDWDESNLEAKTSGSYAKIGADFNAYRNWIGMNNSINIGLRYGFSTFTQELIAYQVYTTDQTFPPVYTFNMQEYTRLSAHWIELIVSVKAEVLTNLYLSINFQLKRKMSEDVPENFANLYIPGFNRTYDYSEVGVGYGYGITYLIPIYKK